MDHSEVPELNLREQLIRIDKMLADNHDRKRQEIRFAPWQLVLGGVLGGMTAGAAFFAAGAAFIKLLPS